MASATIHEKLGSGPGNGGARLIVGVILGFGITLFLFWLMQYMIETADRSLDEGSRGSLVDFVRVQRDETIQRRQVKPKKPPPPGKRAAATAHATTGQSRPDGRENRHIRRAG